MPQYIYSNPENPDEHVEVIQSVHEDHVFVKDGIVWQREFTLPNASADTKIDAFDKTDFLCKTAGKKGSLGNLMDCSRELSEKRAERSGSDPVQESYYEDYKKKRGGKHEHPEVVKRKSREKLRKLGFELD